MINGLVVSKEIVNIPVGYQGEIAIIYMPISEYYEMNLLAAEKRIQMKKSAVKQQVYRDRKRQEEVNVPRYNLSETGENLNRISPNTNETNVPTRKLYIGNIDIVDPQISSNII